MNSKQGPRAAGMRTIVNAASRQRDAVQISAYLSEATA
jgi:hypothetical protein